jgi:hypothetical protein
VDRTYHHANRDLVVVGGPLAVRLRISRRRRADQSGSVQDTHTGAHTISDASVSPQRMAAATKPHASRTFFQATRS